MRIPRPLMPLSKSTTVAVEKSTATVEKLEEVSGRESQNFLQSEYIRSQNQIYPRELPNPFFPSRVSNVSPSQIGFRVASVIAKYTIYLNSIVNKVEIVSNETTYSGYVTYCEDSGESIIILNEEKELSQFFGQELQAKDDYEFPPYSVRMYNCDLSKVILLERIESNIHREYHHVWKNKEEEVPW